ncbi:hypothetical protein ABPG73_021816 [Tetrahymena malaccensis]
MKEGGCLNINQEEKRFIFCLGKMIQEEQTIKNKQAVLMILFAFKFSVLTKQLTFRKYVQKELTDDNYFLMCLFVFFVCFSKSVFVNKYVGLLKM